MRLGQVTSGKKYWSDNSLVAGEQFEYTFDDIGNRKQSRYGGDASGAGLRRFNYSANLLNQYSSRNAGPGTTRFANVLGEATNAATVTVNNQATYRRGDYFRTELAVTNTGPVWLGVTNLAVLNQGTNADIIATNLGNVFVSPTPESFTNDLDGNLISDGRWMLTWDAENRLVKAESLTNAPAGSKRKVEWVFDALGRRIRQTEYVWNPSTTNYQPSTDIKLVSDGWRNIAELDTTNLTLRTYCWGLDLSGSLDGAGGVGGLLLVTRHLPLLTCHAVAYDGNGNVAALVSMEDGAESARYEYGPFGELLRATGPMALENPFRFSTKRASDPTDWVLYELRAYNPGTGRWLSRDLIGEKGGANQVSYSGNNLVNTVDLLGMAIACKCPEAYFKDIGLKPEMYSKSDSGDTYNAVTGASGPKGGAGLIIWRMLQTSHTFTVKSSSVEELKKHVNARMTIVNNAKAVKWSFGAGDERSIHHIITPNPIFSPLRPDQVQEYFNSINNSETKMACREAAEIVFQTGALFEGYYARNVDGIWVPGDRSRVRNKAQEVHPANWVNKNGLEGENVIHVGVDDGNSDLFWGLFGGENIRSEKEWFNEIEGWLGDDGKEHGEPAWREKIVYPKIGLE